MRSNRDYEKKTKDFEPDVTITDEESIVEAPKENKKPTKIIVTINNLALRDAPNGNKIGMVSMGFNTIVDEVDGWGKLEDGSGWIKLEFTRKAD